MAFTLTIEVAGSHGEAGAVLGVDVLYGITRVFRLSSERACWTQAEGQEMRHINC